MQRRAPLLTLARNAGWCGGVVLPWVLSVSAVGCDVTLDLIGRLTTDSGNGFVADVDTGALTDAGSTLVDDDSSADAATEDAQLDDVLSIEATTSDAQGLGPFGPATLLTPVSTNGATMSYDEDPTLTGDQCELYFESSRMANNQDVWVSRRATKNDSWGAPLRVAELSSTSAEQGPAVSLDGLTIWFGSNRNKTATADYDIWTSSRASRTDASGAPTKWGVPTRVAELATTSVETAPSVDESELVMVFMSNRPGGMGRYDIYMTTRAKKSDPWGTAVDLPNVNTANDEQDPFISGASLQLFWSFVVGTGPGTIMSASRLSPTAPFTNAQSLTELGKPDYCPTLSLDLRHIYFGSDRVGLRRIYEASR